MNSRQAERFLKRQGCWFETARGGGSHKHVFRRDANGTLRRSVLPMHGKKELGTGLWNKILKDLGLN